MPDPHYKPVPVVAATAIADGFDKDVVVIISWDRVSNLVHTTTYGRAPADKLSAAKLGHILATAAGCDLSQATSFEDFRGVPEAEATTRDELLTKLLVRADDVISALYDLIEIDGDVELAQQAIGDLTDQIKSATRKPTKERP